MLLRVFKFMSSLDRDKLVKAYLREQQLLLNPMENS